VTILYISMDNWLYCSVQTVQYCTEDAVLDHRPVADPVQYCTEDSVLDRPQVAKVMDRPQRSKAR
jgi:hypothetical protein